MRPLALENPVDRRLAFLVDTPQHRQRLQTPQRVEDVAVGPVAGGCVVEAAVRAAAVEVLDEVLVDVVERKGEQAAKELQVRLEAFENELKITERKIEVVNKYLKRLAEPQE